MDVTGLHPRAREALVKAGWSEAYRGPDVGYAGELTKRGFEVPERAREFFARFGGLFVHETPVIPQASTLYFHTDALRLASRLLPGWMQDWEAEIETRLCPIGETGYAQYMLMMDRYGRVFGVNTSHDLTFWADDGLGLLKMVFAGGSCRPVDDDDRQPPTNQD